MLAQPPRGERPHKTEAVLERYCHKPRDVGLLGSASKGESPAGDSTENTVLLTP